MTEEELIEAKKELRRQNRPEVVELELEDMDKAAGGYFFHPQVCSSSFDDGDTCWFNDYCSQMWNLYALKDDNSSARCERTVKSTDWHRYDE